MLIKSAKSMSLILLSHALQRISAGPIRVLLAAALVFPLLAFGSLPAGSASPGAAVVAGTVTSPGAAAMPGVTVDLYAWPSDAVLKAMKPGEAVPTTLRATATTDNAGEYTLRVPAGRLKAAAVESGYANLEIVSPPADGSCHIRPAGRLRGRQLSLLHLPARSATTGRSLRRTFLTIAHKGIH